MIEAALRASRRGTAVHSVGLTRRVGRWMHPGVRRPGLEFITIIV
jgi:hypothetical protein